MVKNFAEIKLCREKNIGKRCIWEGKTLEIEINGGKCFGRERVMRLMGSCEGSPSHFPLRFTNMTFLDTHHTVGKESYNQLVRYRVVTASEYLVITECYIDDIKLAKKAWILLGQHRTTFGVSPMNYTFEVHAMSVEKLSYLLPTVFTIGPRMDDFDSLLRYAKLLSSHDQYSNDVRELAQGIIVGGTHILAAGMTMEQAFKGTKELKKEVFDKVQLELNQFGLLIYNANIKQLVDIKGHEYFSYLGQ
ncbi:hypothetical protein GIB67_022063 [Kingdonia uniflora]|uniref:Flotillin-like n=1 Tax=Kingdonia uniflora TaxID=39325 RepID=A0A7J7MU98_9MAGN|nr:hypothetical protein GIB67_022063 [Kingdonia uniflora]